MMHFCSGSDGMMISKDRFTGENIVSRVLTLTWSIHVYTVTCMFIITIWYTGHTAWQAMFDSPVNAVYALEGGALRRVPITTTGRGTLDRLTHSSALALKTETSRIKATDSVFR